jgi:hypothetical protein
MQNNSYSKVYNQVTKVYVIQHTWPVCYNHVSYTVCVFELNSVRRTQYFYCYADKQYFHPVEMLKYSLSAFWVLEESVLRFSIL